MTVRVLLAVLAAFFSPAAALAACTTYDVQATQTNGQTYSPNDVLDRVVSIQFRAPTGLETACRNVSVKLTPREGAITLRNGGTVLPARFTVIGGAGALIGSSFELGPLARLDLVRSGATNLSVLRLEGGQFVPPGDYTTILDVTVGDGPPTPVTVTVTVEAALRIIGGTGVRALSLGDVTQGSEATDTFYYRTNSTISVAISSQNRGVLQHMNGPSFGSIPYDFYLSGQRVALDTAAALQIDFRQSTLQFETVRLVVAPQSGSYAGTYSDVITMDLAAF